MQWSHTTISFFHSHFSSNITSKQATSHFSLKILPCSCTIPPSIYYSHFSSNICTGNITSLSKHTLPCSYTMPSSLFTTRISLPTSALATLHLILTTLPCSHTMPQYLFTTSISLPTSAQATSHFSLKILPCSCTIPPSLYHLHFSSNICTGNIAFYSEHTMACSHIHQAIISLLLTFIAMLSYHGTISLFSTHISLPTSALETSYPSLSKHTLLPCSLTMIPFIDIIYIHICPFHFYSNICNGNVTSLFGTIPHLSHLCISPKAWHYFARLWLEPTFLPVTMEK